MSAVQRAVRAVEMTAMVTAANPLHELVADAIHALRHIRAIAKREAVPASDRLFLLHAVRDGTDGAIELHLVHRTKQEVDQ